MKAAKAYQSASKTFARNALITDHLEYANAICNTIISSLPSNADKDSLFQQAALGLVQAAHKYDPSSEVKFKTFAYNRIRGSIYDELRKNSPFTQVIFEKAKKIKGILDRNEPPVTQEFISKETSIPVEEVNDLLALLDVFQFSSIEDGEQNREEHVQNRYQNPESLLEQREDVELIARCIAKLKQTEQVVLNLTFREHTPLNQKEIAEVLNLNPSQICRILKKACFDVAQLYKAEMNRRPKIVNLSEEGVKNDAI